MNPAWDDPTDLLATCLNPELIAAKSVILLAGICILIFNIKSDGTNKAKQSVDPLMSQSNFTNGSSWQGLMSTNFIGIYYSLFSFEGHAHGQFNPLTHPNSPWTGRDSTLTLFSCYNFCKVKHQSNKIIIIIITIEIKGLQQTKTTCIIQAAIR